MRNFIIIILGAILSILSASAQVKDVHVYLKNGEIHSFFNERADSITVDNDTNLQHIWSQDSTFTIPVAEIDSVRFGSRELPTSLYAEDFSGWSDVLFCNNGLTAFHANKTESEPEKSILLIPDEEYGIIISYAEYDDDSKPTVVTFNDEIVFISQDSDGSSQLTIVKDDSLVYQLRGIDADYKEIVRGQKRALADNNWSRNLVAVGSIILGAAEVGGGTVMIVASVVGEAGTVGLSTPISVPGLLAGSLAVKGGSDLLVSGLTTVFIPAAESSKGKDNYLLNASAGCITNGISIGLTKPETQKWLLEHLPKDAMRYLRKAPNTPKWTSWTWVGDLALGFFDNFWGETITKADRLARLYAKGNIITGIATDITPYSALVRGYVDPNLTKGLNGENIDIEYGIIVEGNGRHYTKNIKNGNGGLIEFIVDGVHPSSKYDYYTFLWNKTDAVLYTPEIKEFTTPAKPIAITGFCSNITPKTTNVYASFENVPKDAICGIEYSWAKGKSFKELGCINGAKNISLSGLFPGTVYEYRAYIEAYGQTYYGDTKSFTTESINCSVSLSDFKVTKSQYKEGGFTNDGKKYDFRFDTSVTGTIETDDISYIKEWGYVYEDPEGKTAEIPLSGTKETVTRYAYFRNSAHSTARLYGYAYIDGIDEPIYYEVHDFPLDHIMAVANTGECEKVTANSAIVSCSFENIPEGATCGIEYSESDNWSKQTASSKEGTQKVTLNGLKPGTKYNYRAYINDGGQMYYGGQQEFTTAVDLPDLTGTWSCTIYKDDGSVLNQCTFHFTDDHKVTQKDSNWIKEGEIGSWSINTTGNVGVNFSWAGGSQYNPTWYSEKYSGQVDDLSHPSSIEGKVSRKWAGLSEHGNTYQFKMTR